MPRDDYKPFSISANVMRYHSQRREMLDAAIADASDNRERRDLRRQFRADCEAFAALAIHNAG